MKYYIATKQEFYNQANRYGFVEQECEHCGTSFENSEEFETLADAQAWVAENDEEVYHTSHNEAGRWELKILDGNEAWRFAQALLHEDLGGNQYDWDHCEDGENPTDEEIATACEAVENAAWDALEEAE